MPTLRKFHLPDPGEGLTEAEVAQWLVAVGDTVTVNQVVVEVETAKSLVELPCPYAGTVVQLLAEEGETVNVGEPIIVIDIDPDGAAPAGDAPEESGAVLVGYGVTEPAPSRRRPEAAAAAAAPAPPTEVPVPEAERTPTSSRRVEVRPVLAKPPVRRLARDLGIDLSTVTPSGPGGIVTREDVMARVQATKPTTLAAYPNDEQAWLDSGTVSTDGRSTRVPVRSVRKRTAEAMVESAFTAPHVSVSHRIDVTKTMRLVSQLRADPDFADAQVTPLLIAMKALIIAVRRHPEINASWDDAAKEIVYKHYINLGFAAATPRGLVVPNIKDAHRLTLRELGEEFKVLTHAARTGNTTPRDTTDGTITVSNVGAFGIDTGTPILNPGEAAILAFGAIRPQPWVHKGKVKPRSVAELTLSFDHRLVDGELGSLVLADVAAVLQDPTRALVWL